MKAKEFISTAWFLEVRRVTGAVYRVIGGRSVPTRARTDNGGFRINEGMKNTRLVIPEDYNRNK